MSADPRQFPPWKRLVVGTIATWFGSGHSPIWPGTAGTLATIPLAWVLMGLGRGWLVGATIALFLAGVWAAEHYCEMTGTHDNGRIVIDEVVGYLITLWPVSRSIPNIVVGFALFRLFDIWKPWPIRVVDRQVKGGFGVVFDDVCAGVASAVVLYLLQPYLVRFA